MSVVPVERSARIAFYKNHLVPWTANAAAIGLATATVAELSTLVEAAIQAGSNAELARQASKAATEAYTQAASAVSRVGAGSMATIRGFADATNDPNVYVLAEIPAPSSGTPMPPPGVPTDFRVALTQDGDIILKWKCANPKGTNGTIYEVRRRPIGTTAAWNFIGATGTRSFTDDSIIAPSAGVTYQVTAVRSTQRGLPGQFNVGFGTAGGGLVIASVTDMNGAKLAA